MKKTIKLFIGLLALTASVFAARDQFSPWQFPEDSLHRKVQEGKIITSEELTAENVGELAPTRTRTILASSGPGMNGEEIEEPAERITETGKEVTLFTLIKDTFLTKQSEEPYQSLLNIIRFQANQDNANLYGVFLTAIANTELLENFIDKDNDNAEDGTPNDYPLQNFINFWYALGLRLDTANIRGTTVATFLNENFDDPIAARVIAAFQEAERLAQANAPIIEEEIIPAAAQPEGEPTGAQTLNQRLNPAAAQRMIEEQARTDVFRLGPSVFGGICPCCNLL